MTVLRILSPSDPDYAARLRALATRVSALPEAVEASARAVVLDVRARGDAAVREYTARFEKRELPSLELDRGTWAESARAVAPQVRSALERAAARVRAF